MFYRSDLARQGGSGWDGKVPRCRCPMAGVVAPPNMRTRLNHVKSHSQRVMNHEADRIVP